MHKLIFVFCAKAQSIQSLKQCGHNKIILFTASSNTKVHHYSLLFVLRLLVQLTQLLFLFSLMGGAEPNSFASQPKGRVRSECSFLAKGRVRVLLYCPSSLNSHKLLRPSLFIRRCLFHPHCFHLKRIQVRIISKHSIAKGNRTIKDNTAMSLSFASKLHTHRFT